VFIDSLVGTEAFAEMGKATVNHPESLARIKQHFPKWKALNREKTCSGNGTRTMSYRLVLSMFIDHSVGTEAFAETAGGGGTAEAGGKRPGYRENRKQGLSQRDMAGCGDRKRKAPLCGTA
jgi:hypothetical protein